MELFVSYKSRRSFGRMRIRTSRNELWFSDIEDIEKEVRKQCGDDGVIIENIIKLPIM